MGAFLRIENPGVCPPEAFCVLGVSLADTSSEDGNTIGLFGSGAKYGVVACLRHDVAPIVFAGTLKLEFSVRPQTVTGGNASKDFGRVVVKYGGTDPFTGASRSSTEDLGFVLDFGKQDWSGVDLALREFVSNALDCSLREQGNWDDVKVEVVNANQVRARAGYTRIFVPLNNDVLEFYNNLSRWFLHFSEPESLHRQVLPKARRNFGDRKAAVIYRRGVRVREFESSETPSLFDYNLNNLKLDESRRVDDWYCRFYAGRALAEANKEELVVFLDRLATSKAPFWESEFDDLKPSSWWTGTQFTTHKQAWNEAFEIAIGGQGVLTDGSHADRLEKKGFKPVRVPENFLRAAEQYAVPTALTILSADELVGRSVTDATPAAQAVTDYVWDLLASVGMTGDKPKPPVKCFTSISDAGRELFGYYKDGGIFLNVELLGEGTERQDFSEKLIQVVLEELAHYVSGACDFTRDMQNCAFQLAAKLIARPPLT